MIYLKEANFEDLKKEYEAIKKFPENENGFENSYAKISFEEFKNEVLPRLIDNSKGINLPIGYVKATYYFLWDDENIVGLFKFRHELNEKLRNGAGHIGYGILSDYRGKGYASIGLGLLIEIAKEVIKEDEIYLSCHKNNIASLKVQLKNGAYIHHIDDKENYTRIKIR